MTESTTTIEGIAMGKGNNAQGKEKKKPKKGAKTAPAKPTPGPKK
ncbi:MAG TPA: hypothetical protein VGL71_02290 [Urbifossiella sp.]